MRSNVRSWRLLLLAGLLGLQGWSSASDRKLEPDDSVLGVIAKLSAERFSERETAARQLERFGPDVFPLLKQLLETTAEQELRLRLRLVLKRLALVAETNPEALAQYAREEAEARRFMESSRFYARAAYAFRAEAAHRSGEERTLWETRAKRAEERARRAEEWAQAVISGRVMEQAGRSFIILTQQANGQAAVEYREVDLRSLTDW
jgi:hypothetical protein